jgi:hypothetical protein
VSFDQPIEFIIIGAMQVVGENTERRQQQYFNQQKKGLINEHQQRQENKI